jgi:hypothetical protein
MNQMNEIWSAYKSKMFDKVALYSSSVYFLIFFIYLVLVVSKYDIPMEIRSTLYGCLLVTLILPILYFIKAGISSLNSDIIIDKYQKLVLVVYFLLILLKLIFYFANVDDQNYIMYIKLYILPFLVVFSFYCIYAQLQSTKKLPTNLMYLFSLLALLYYTSLFDVATEIQYSKRFDELIIIEAIIAFFLIFLFGIIAYNTN